jgi:hypothetical protein
VSSKWDQIATLCAAAGLVVTSLFSWQAQLLAEKSLKTAQDAYAVSETAYTSALASKFYLGEVPPSEGQGPGPELAAINANPVDMYEVWVRGTLNGEPADARIWTIQACTGYKFPDGYQPDLLHFFDGTNSWTRRIDGQLTRSNSRNPVPSTGAIETTTFSASGCA